MIAQQGNSGSYEVPDWEGGEDKNQSGLGDRGVEFDDTATGGRYPNINLRFFNGDPYTANNANARGNPLPVAFRLLAEGGQNPACGRSNQPPPSNYCHDVIGLGVEQAFQIFFTMLDVYATPNTDWNNFKFDIIAAAGHYDSHQVRLTQPIKAKISPIGFPPCVRVTTFQYDVWKSIAGIGWGGNLRFCFLD